MGLLSRREALLGTVGCAAACIIPAASRPAQAAPPRQAVQREDIDRALRAKVDGNEIPGVVAMAANGDTLLYEPARLSHRG
jgi:methyl acetate hydrolase